jgi:hypothetical protein
MGDGGKAAQAAQAQHPSLQLPADKELLQDALSLLVYDKPEESPNAYLLKTSHRVGSSVLLLLLLVLVNPAGHQYTPFENASRKHVGWFIPFLFYCSFQNICRTPFQI